MESLDLQGSDLSSMVCWWRTHGRYLLTQQTEFGNHPTRDGESSGDMMAIPTAKQAPFFNKLP